MWWEDFTYSKATAIDWYLLEKIHNFKIGSFLEYIGVYTQHFEKWLFEEEKAIFPPIYGIWQNKRITWKYQSSSGLLSLNYQVKVIHRKLS